MRLLCVLALSSLFVCAHADTTERHLARAMAHWTLEDYDSALEDLEFAFSDVDSEELAYKALHCVRALKEMALVLPASEKIGEAFFVLCVIEEYLIQLVPDEEEDEDYGFFLLAGEK